MTKRHQRLAAGFLAISVLFGTPVLASSDSDPDFGDLVTPATSHTASLSKVDGSTLLPALGPDYRSLQLLGALEAVETAVAGGQYISQEAQQALDLHATKWRTAYQTQLGEGEGQLGLDQLFEATLSEQSVPSSVGVYAEVARRLEALSFATTRYHMALSLKRSGLGGYRTHTTRPAGTVGLDASEYQELSLGYAPQLQEGITNSTQELRALLQKS